jgi:PAS domain S-box-containing protein
VALNQSARDLAVQYATARVLAEAGSVAEALPRVLQALCTSVSWDYGAYWTALPGRPSLRCEAVWHAPELHASEFVEASRGSELPTGLGLPGRVLKTRAPLWVRDIAADDNFPRAKPALAAGLHGAFALPVFVEGEILGVMEFFHQAVQPPDEPLLHLMEATGRQIGQFLQRKRALEERDQQRAWLHALVTQAPIPMAVLRGPRHIVELVNLELGRLVTPGRDIIGRPLRDVFPELETQGLVELLDLAYEIGEPQVLRERTVRVPRDGLGTDVVVSVALQPLRDASGQVMGLVVFGFDETRQVQARRLLEAQISARRATEQSYRFLTEVIPQIIWTATPDGTIGYHNSRWYEHTGIGAGTDWRLAVHPEDRPRVASEWHKALERGVPFELEYRIRRADDAYRWFLGRTVPFRDAAGEVVSWFGTATDIDDRKRAEEERDRFLAEERALRTRAEMAQRNAARLQAVTAALSQAVTPEQVAQVVVAECVNAVAGAWGSLGVLTADRGRLEIVASVGEGNEDVLAATRSLALDAGVPITDAARTGATLWLADREANSARYPETIWMLEKLGLHSWGAFPLVVEGRPIGAVALACPAPHVLGDDERDLLLAMAWQGAQALERARLFRAEQAARAHAEAANRAKDEFLAMLGHELRNPLAPILTALEMMKLRGDDKMEHERTVLERQVRHVVSLVDDLLDVSRVTRGKIALRREALEISQVVTKAIEMASPLLEQKAHTLRVDVPRHGLVVDADPMRLAQIVANLVTNAAKYTDGGGQVSVVASRDGQEVALRVRDTGVGIAPAMLPHIFDLFVQGERSLDRGQGGLGIGLTIVRSLVELHGGRVSAASEGVGKGSEFTVRLPAAVAMVSEVLADSPTIPIARVGALATGPSPAESPAPLSARGKRVLVVDDNTDAADLLAEALRQAGHEVAVSYDGPRALEAATSFRPHAAILDIGLPVMDGYELARRLRAQADGICLVALTGYGQESDRLRALQAGFDAHMVKPIDVNSVRAILEGTS